MTTNIPPRNKPDRRQSPRIVRNPALDSSLLPEYVKEFQIRPAAKFPSTPRRKETDPAQLDSAKGAAIPPTHPDRRGTARMPMSPVGTPPNIGNVKQ